MSIILSQILNGLMLGATYSLIAIGFSLYFGVMNVCVFCVGDVALFGAYMVIGLLLVNLFATGSTAATILSIAIAALLTGLLMLVMYRIVIKPLERKGSHMPLLATIAAGLVLREGIAIFFPQGRNPHVFPTIIPEDYRNLVILGVTALIIIVLYLFINRTKLGVSVQAVAQNKEAAVMIGINSKVVVYATLLIGGLVLAIAGTLLDSYYGMIRYDMGVNYGLIGFSAAVVGGLGNINGAIVGGMLLAMVEVFMSAFVPGGTAYASIASFAVVVLLIITKPEGIMGKKTVENV